MYVFQMVRVNALEGNMNYHMNYHMNYELTSKKTTLGFPIMAIATESLRLFPPLSSHACHHVMS